MTCLLVAQNPCWAKDHELYEPLAGVASHHTQTVLELIKHWPTPEVLAILNQPDSGGIALKCLKTLEQPFYIGVIHGLVIHSPFSGVNSLISDFGGNIEIYDGLKKAEIKNTSANLFEVFSEQWIPLPFVPNEKTVMYYLVNELEVAGKKRAIFRYQLKQSNHLEKSDGAIILDEIDSKTTRMAEFDFFDADWGILKTLAPSRIWRDSVRALLQTDLAVKIKTENPQLSNKEVHDQSMAIADKIDVEKYISDAGVQR